MSFSFSFKTQLFSESYIQSLDIYKNYIQQPQSCIDCFTKEETNILSWNASLRPNLLLLWCTIDGKDVYFFNGEKNGQASLVDTEMSR